LLSVKYAELWQGPLWKAAGTQAGTYGWGAANVQATGLEAQPQPADALPLAA